MSHVTYLTAGNGGARLLPGLVEVRPEEDIHVLVNVGADFEAWGLYCCPDIDLVLYTLAGELDPYRTSADPVETYGCFEAIRKLGLPASVPISDRELATHLMRTEILGGGASLEAATEQLAERFGIGPVLMPVSNDPIRTMVDTPASGSLKVAEYLARAREPGDTMEVHHEGANEARPLDRAIRSILEADRVILAPADPRYGLGALLSMSEIRGALTRTPASVVAISPIIGSQPARGSGERSAEPDSLIRFARELRGIVDSLVIHTTDLPYVEQVRESGTDAWVDNILINSRDDAIRLAGRIVFPDRLVARKR